MTPKEKAKELVENFLNNIEDRTGTFLLSNYSSKQCALIAVEDIIEIELRNFEMEIYNELNFWEEVKNEIKNL